MSLEAVGVWTIVNSALFIFLCDVYRRKTYRTKWKYQLIALMGAVFLCEAAMLYSKVTELLNELM